MALRRILKFPASELKQNAAPVGAIDGRVNELLGDMADTMYAAPGVGLAAPQVGISERLITLDVDHESPGTQLLKLINPEIVAREGTVMWEEACLSVVDYAAEVRRSARVLVRAWTLDQRQIEIEAEGLLAVALQHEIDHLDGKLFIDRLSSLKRESYKRKLKKMLREGVDLDTLPSRPSTEREPDERQDAEDAI
jgi:peptide deformylase